MFRKNKRGQSSSMINPQELELKLNLSPPRRVATRTPLPAIVVRPRRRSTTSSESEVSPPRSCVSSEDNLKYPSSPEINSMVLAGCPRCLMYVMVVDSDPSCPRCRSPVILDFLNNNNNNNNSNNNNNDGGHVDDN